MQAKKNFEYSTHGESVFHANPFPQDHFINSYHPSYSYMSPVMGYYCESSGHDVVTCPFCTYIDATRASVEKKINELIDKMIENMKERIPEYSQCLIKVGRIVISLILV